MSSLLDNINSPRDIHRLNDQELLNLSDEIRDFLIENVSKTGGHLSSNLGVVDLTISLYKSFDFEVDKIVWDVGHQAYVHKMFTGRKDKFNTLRQFNGLCGFTKRSESKYDAFGVGHSSTSISAAVGIARARDLKKEDYNVIAVIGDGALTGGMALEALNDVGFNKTNMIIILNDNQMSISNNVGALSNHLNKLRVGIGYNKFKEDVNSKLGSSDTGKLVIHSLHKLKDSLKHLLVPSMFFENMGLKYIGPIDGHDIKLMNEVLVKAKKMHGPVVIHTITKKGKGYEFAEENPNKFHGVSPFNLESGKSYSSKEVTYSKVFGDSMIEIAKENKDLVAITAAMPDGTGLKEFARLYRDRFFDVGIAEQHAVTLAAGMASAGLRPVFAVYSTFLQRGFDQILHDVCIQNLPVIFSIDRAGIVGEDGETHQGVFDLSYLSQIPNIKIIAPKQLEELPIMLKWALQEEGPIAIRYPRGTDNYGYKDLIPLTEVKNGRWQKVKYGKDIAIVAVGKMVQHAMIAAKKLQDKNINIQVINASFIKPIDTVMIEKLSKEFNNIITIEDNVITGGFGSSVLLELNKVNYKGNFIALGFKDEFIPHGDVETIYNKYNLDPEGIENTVLDIIKTKGE